MAPKSKSVTGATKAVSTSASVVAPNAEPFLREESFNEIEASSENVAVDDKGHKDKNIWITLKDQSARNKGRNAVLSRDLV